MFTQNTSQESSFTNDAEKRATHIAKSMPEGGLFAGHKWRIASQPFVISKLEYEKMERLGRVLLKFYQAVNLLAKRSTQAEYQWVREILEQGKPKELLTLSSQQAFSQQIPRVIRPDILLSEQGLSIVELDSLPGGIGLLACLNRAYEQLDFNVVGAGDKMLTGFRSIFADTPAEQIGLVVSEEASTYRPEMSWLAKELGFQLLDANSEELAGFRAFYRFFELFDLANVPIAKKIFERAITGEASVTPAPRPVFEEKLLLALLWNRNLHDYWRTELGQKFFSYLKELVPYSWIVTPEPLAKHGVIPQLEIANFEELKFLSKNERQLVLKISGYSELAWGSRGVYVGHDLSAAEWGEAVELALQSFAKSPYVLQRFHKTQLRKINWYDFTSKEERTLEGRVRLCPYYFVQGEREKQRAELSGILATIVPADKKLIHGMSEAILAPCVIE